MPIATLVNTINTDSVPNYMICEYSSDGVAADSTSIELIELTLPSRNNNAPTYRVAPNVTSGGEAFIISLKVFNISSNSTNFDVRILNINDITRINTINEVLVYETINLSESDQSFESFIIRNRDVILDNKLYLFINNHDSIATGTIRVEFIYSTIQDRKF